MCQLIQQWRHFRGPLAADDRPQQQRPPAAAEDGLERGRAGRRGAGHRRAHQRRRRARQAGPIQRYNI